MTTTPVANGAVANGHRTTHEQSGEVTPEAREAASAARRASQGGREPFAPWAGEETPVQSGAAQAAAWMPQMYEVPGWAVELREWWTATADSDISGSLDKIVEYGGSGPAYDLLATGHDLAAMNGRRVSDEEAVELAIMMYLSSKVNRWLAAAKDGRRPSDDTLLDITYYSLMARRNRAVGGWPVA